MSFWDVVQIHGAGILLLALICVIAAKLGHFRMIEAKFILGLLVWTIGLGVYLWSTANPGAASGIAMGTGYLIWAMILTLVSVMPLVLIMARIARMIDR
ncbi:MAG: hypothetical protein ACI841_000087 [Planctomycetota bacterium]|jgi:hypothetical protein